MFTRSPLTTVFKEQIQLITMNPYKASRKFKSWDKSCLCVTKVIHLILEASKYQGDINHYYVYVQDVWVSLSSDRLQGPSSWKERRTKKI